MAWKMMAKWSHSRRHSRMLKCRATRYLYPDARDLRIADNSDCSNFHWRCWNASVLIVREESYRPKIGELPAISRTAIERWRIQGVPQLFLLWNIILLGIDIFFIKIFSKKVAFANTFQDALNNFHHSISNRGNKK